MTRSRGIICGALMSVVLVSGACGTRVTSETARSADPGTAAATALPAADDDAASAATASAPAATATNASPAGGPAAAPANRSATPLSETATASPGGSTSGSPASARPTPRNAQGPTPGGRPAASNGPATPAPGGPLPGSPAPAPKAGDNSPIVVGNVGTYTGPAGASLKHFPAGVKVWAGAVNDAGGINGHPVKVIVADDGGDPARHRSLAQDLVETKKVIAFVANGEAISGESTVGYLTQKRVPVIGGDTGSDWFHTSPMYFPQGPSGITYWASMIPGLAQVALPKGLKKFGSMVCVEAPSCAPGDKLWHDDGAARNAGFEDVYRAKISLAQPDYTAECLSAQRSGAQVVATIVDDTTISRLAASCARQGYRPAWVWPLTPAATRHKDDPNLDGAIIIANWLPWVKSGTPATAEFQAAMKKYYGGTAEPGHAGGWVSAKLFEKAARTTADPTSSAGILEGLWSLRGETLGGMSMPLSFPREQPAPRTLCWGQVLIEKGRYVMVNNGEITCRP